MNTQNYGERGLGTKREKGGIGRDTNGAIDMHPNGREYERDNFFTRGGGRFIVLFIRNVYPG